MDETLRGLRVYRASRLEALVAPLESLLDAWLPEDLLAPQTVLAAHPGIQRWLTRELARRRGAADVVANLDVILPGTWLESEMQTRAGQTAQPAYRREVLRWRVLDALDAIEDPSLSRYLDGADRSQTASPHSTRAISCIDRTFWRLGNRADRACRRGHSLRRFGAVCAPTSPVRTAAN